MIVRILGEGQWELGSEDLTGLNALDDAVEQAVTADRQEDLSAALHALLDRVRTTATPVVDDDLRHSDLVLPAVDSTVADVQAMLSDSDQGFFPN